ASQVVQQGLQGLGDGDELQEAVDDGDEGVVEAFSLDHDHQQSFEVLQTYLGQRFQAQIFWDQWLHHGAGELQAIPDPLCHLLAQQQPVQHLPNGPMLTLSSPLTRSWPTQPGTRFEISLGSGGVIPSLKNPSREESGMWYSSMTSLTFVCTSCLFLSGTMFIAAVRASSVIWKPCSQLRRPSRFADQGISLPSSGRNTLSFRANEANTGRRLGLMWKKLQKRVVVYRWQGM
ncbi:hypothetical protein CRUP_024275, partial [Coryphaenoides rupestris]